VTYEYKGYKITPSDRYALKVVKPIGKGSVPAPLTGLYTSSGEAERSIDIYLTEKEKPRAKTKRTS